MQILQIKHLWIRKTNLICCESCVGIFFWPHEIPNRVNSYWNDWILPAKLTKCELNFPGWKWMHWSSSRYLLFRCGEQLAGVWSLSPWVCMACCTCLRNSPGQPKPRKEPWRDSLWNTPPRNFKWSSVSPAQTAATKCNSRSSSGYSHPSPFEIRV